jgi:hypothetical protein
MDIAYSREHNIGLLDFRSLFRGIELSFINEVHDLGMLSGGTLNLKDGDVKRLFLHHTIFTLCEKLLQTDVRCRKVVVFTPFNQDPQIELLQYCDPVQLNKLITRTLKDVTKRLPIFVHFADHPDDLQ